MRESLTQLLEDLVPRICKIYGDNLVAIILYGSFARDTASEESDVDIALLIKKEDSTMHDEMLDAFVDLDLEYDRVISPSLIEIDKFDKWKSVLPYYRNIENEGVVLWKAA